MARVADRSDLGLWISFGFRFSVFGFIPAHQWFESSRQKLADEARRFAQLLYRSENVTLGRGRNVTLAGPECGGE